MKFIKQYDYDFTKKYWLFYTECYYPQGGLDDLVNTFDSLEKVIERILINNIDSIYNFNIFNSFRKTNLDLGFLPKKISKEEIKKHLLNATIA